MSDEIVLYTNPMSRGRIARWILEEVGAPYRAEVLEYDTTMKGSEYLAINPMGEVPAIRHGFAEYWKRVSDRDAYRRASELDDASMPKKKD